MAPEVIHPARVLQSKFARHLGEIEGSAPLVRPEEGLFYGLRHAWRIR